MTMPIRRTMSMVLLAAVVASSMAGCVRRTLTITSEPSGAIVMLNDREVGRTPVEVEFLWYGHYDVRMSLEGHEPLVTKGAVWAPVWDTLPLDLAAELSPFRHTVRRNLHYVLSPSEPDDDALVDRARHMRSATLHETE